MIIVSKRCLVLSSHGGLPSLSDPMQPNLPPPFTHVWPCLASSAPKVKATSRNLLGVFVDDDPKTVIRIVTTRSRIMYLACGSNDVGITYETLESL
jgi:hypothetical protein